MEKTLSTIMLFNKIGKILSKIVFIVCIVAAVILLLAVAMLTTGFESFELGDVIFKGLIEEAGDMTTDEIYLALGIDLIYVIAYVVLAKFSLSYFSKVLKAGTPFTSESSKGIFRLGIILLVIPFVLAIMASVIISVKPEFKPIFDEVNFGGFQASDGILFIFLSFVYKYVAEKEAKQKKR